jgi:hypothetical protein
LLLDEPGTGHRWAPLARTAAEELTARLGIPCTDVAVPASIRDPGDASADAVASYLAVGRDPVCRAPMHYDTADPLRCELRYGHPGHHQGARDGKRILWPPVVQDGGSLPIRPRAQEDAGDVTCAGADETPEASASYAAGRITGAANNTRDRVLSAVLAFLRASENDWAKLRETLSKLPMSAGAWAADTLDEAKALHDHQLIELFQRIGGAL